MKVTARSCFVMGLGWVLLSAPALGQTVGLGIGAGSFQTTALRSLSLSYQQELTRFLDGQLEVSAGARYSNFARTAELDLGSSRQMFVASLDVHSVNLFGSLRYWLSESLFGGMNLDFVGVSSGSERTLRATAGSQGSARPAGTNLFLGGKNDRGSLNSEFFVGAKLASSFQLRVGWSHQVVEYESSVANEKAQRFYDVFFLGVDLSI